MIEDVVLEVENNTVPPLTVLTKDPESPVTVDSLPAGVPSTDAKIPSHKPPL